MECRISVVYWIQAHTDMALNRAYRDNDCNWLKIKYVKMTSESLDL